MDEKLFDQDSAAIISRSVHQINRANYVAGKIMNDENTDPKLKISASLAVAKTARDVVDIITGNKNIVEKALELDETAKHELDREVAAIVASSAAGQENNDRDISRASTQSEESEEDPEAVF
jgi:hypothetical protein